MTRFIVFEILEESENFQNLGPPPQILKFIKIIFKIFAP